MIQYLPNAFNAQRDVRQDLAVLAARAVAVDKVSPLVEQKGAKEAALVEQKSKT